MSPKNKEVSMVEAPENFVPELTVAKGILSILEKEKRWGDAREILNERLSKEFAEFLTESFPGKELPDIIRSINCIGSLENEVTIYGAPNTFSPCMTEASAVVLWYKAGQTVMYSADVKRVSCGKF